MGSSRQETKLFYKIGEVCKLAGIRPHVLRYWESEFPTLKPRKNRGGQRVYQAKDLELVQRIKRMLHEEGYTIAGAKKQLSGRGSKGAGRGAGDEKAGHAGKAKGAQKVPGRISKPDTGQEMFEFGGGIREKKLEDALKKIKKDIVDLLDTLK